MPESLPSDLSLSASALCSSLGECGVELLLTCDWSECCHRDKQSQKRPVCGSLNVASIIQVNEIASGYNYPVNLAHLFLRKQHKDWLFIQDEVILLVFLMSW